MFQVLPDLFDIGDGEFLKADDVGILLADETEDRVHTLRLGVYAGIAVMKGKTSYIPVQNLHDLSAYRLILNLLRT